MNNPDPTGIDMAFADASGPRSAESNHPLPRPAPGGAESRAGGGGIRQVWEVVGGASEGR